MGTVKSRSTDRPASSVKGMDDEMGEEEAGKKEEEDEDVMEEEEAAFVTSSTFFGIRNVNDCDRNCTTLDFFQANTRPSCTPLLGIVGVGFGRKVDSYPKALRSGRKKSG